MDMLRFLFNSLRSICDMNMSVRYFQIKWMCILFIFILHSCLTTVYVKQLGPTVVTTKYGKLRGSLVEFPKDSYIPLKPVEAYLGIHYAALKRNNLRFMPPTSPQTRWRNIHAASRVASVCPQQYLREKHLSSYLPSGTVEVLTRIGTFTKDQNEDCLSLNLYVPSQGRDSFVKQVAAVHGETAFNRYVTPLQPISDVVKDVTGISHVMTVSNIMTHNGAEVIIITR